MCRTYKNWCDIFPGLARGAYFKKLKTKGKNGRRVKNIISWFVKYWQRIAECHTYFQFARIHALFS